MLVPVALLVATASGGATTLEPAPLDVLVRQADAVVRGVVIAAMAEVPDPARPQVWTRVRVAIADVASGPRELALEPTLELRLPGGETDTLRTVVAGVPTLLPGDDVVLLLMRRDRGHDRAWQPIGYSLGTLFVDSAGRCWRAGDDGRPSILVPGASWPALTRGTLGPP